MARIEAGDLREPEPIFIAGSLRAARRAEEWLTTAGIEYSVEIEPIGRSFLFGSVRMGAAFYVTSSQAAYCRQQLAAAGFDRGIIEGGDDGAVPE